MSEYGFQSFPEYDAVKKYTLPEDEDIESPVMSSHQRSGIGNLRIREYMTQDYRVPKKFGDFLYVSHLLQAEGIKTAIAAHRKNKPYCMGTLYWQLNDCWPVASWSGTDFFRNYKALHYFVKKAYEPVVVIPSLLKDQVEFRVISDDRNLLSGTLSIKTFTLAGKLLFEENKSVKIDPLSNNAAIVIEVNRLTGGHKPDDLVIVASLSVRNIEVSPNLFYLVKPKDLQLTKPVVEFNVNDAGTDWIISVHSDRLAKNLMMTWNGRAGIFSDNYFDILPGETKEIRLPKSVSPLNPLKALAVKSLADTF